MKALVNLLILCWIAFARGKPMTDDDFFEAAETQQVKRLAPRAESALVGEYPYQVSIQIDHRHHCGGSLISLTHVLTAGHCAFDTTTARVRSTRKMTVEVGSVVIGKGQTHKINRIVYQNGFDLLSFSGILLANDIALVELESPVKTSDHVKIIRLPPPDFEVPISGRVVVTGFGSAAFGTSNSPVLKKTELYTVTTEECNEYYTLRMGTFITNNQICAKREPGYGTCHGDSGSPMMYDRKLVGVVSGGTGVCGEGVPDVFTKVSHYLEFIHQVMSNPPNLGKASNMLGY